MIGFTASLRPCAVQASQPSSYLKEMHMDHMEMDRHEESYHLPSAEALIAGTLALMTGYVQAEAFCERRLLLARKLVRNLDSLAQHPQMSLPMQTLLCRLQGHWRTEIDRCADAPDREASPLWHPVASGLQ